jgi:hypothetical protein
MITAFQVRSSLAQGYRRSKPVRNPKYLAFIRKQASVVSGLGPCDACHTGMHGAGQRSSDLSAIPLTRREHARYDEDPRAFAKWHGLDIAAEISRLNALFES